MKQNKKRNNNNNNKIKSSVTFFDSAYSCISGTSFHGEPLKRIYLTRIVFVFLLQLSTTILSNRLCRSRCGSYATPILCISKRLQSTDRFHALRIVIERRKHPTRLECECVTLTTYRNPRPAIVFTNH